MESALKRRAASEARLRGFAADASHELRTPLAAIRGYAELARRHPGPVPDDIAHALSRVESESARMSVLVDELLLLAQLDAGRPLASEPVDLTRLAIDATSDARAAAPGHKWQLELPDEPVVVRGDEYRLRQVLANLLGNAGSHTPPGTTVTVALSEPGPGASSVVLSVTDNGPGIPADLQPGLFERFVRGDSSRSHATGSTGLGLAIVDAVTAAHGGSVGVTSQPGQYHSSPWRGRWRPAWAERPAEHRRRRAHRGPGGCRDVRHGPPGAALTPCPGGHRCRPPSYLVLLGMKAEKLKGHLDLLLLSVLSRGPAHGYEVITRLRCAATGRSRCRRGPYTRRCTGWRARACSPAAGTWWPGGGAASTTSRWRARPRWPSRPRSGGSSAARWAGCWARRRPGRSRPAQRRCWAPACAGLTGGAA